MIIDCDGMIRIQLAPGRSGRSTTFAPHLQPIEPNDLEFFLKKKIKPSLYTAMFRQGSEPIFLVLFFFAKLAIPELVTSQIQRRDSGTWGPI